MRKLHLIVLAAGRGERFGGGKLAALLCGRPLLEHTLKSLAPAATGERVIVLGQGPESLKIISRQCGFEPIDHPESIRGMGSSLGRGAREMLQRLPDDHEGIYALALADMPLVNAELLGQLGDYLLKQGVGVVKPLFQGRGGHPIIFRRSWLERFATLDGDKGARDLLAADPEDVHRLDVVTDAIHFDVDTRENLAEAERRIRGQGDRSQGVGVRKNQKILT